MILSWFPAAGVELSCVISIPADQNIIQNINVCVIIALYRDRLWSQCQNPDPASSWSLDLIFEWEMLVLS